MTLLLRLELRRLLNSVRNLARTPLRLIGALLVFGFFGISLFSQFMVMMMPNHMIHPSPITELFGITPAKLELGLFGVLLLITYHVLNLGFDQGLLTFSAADVDFMFPAPLPRRTVVAFKLVKDYLGMGCLTAFFLAVLMPQLRFMLGASFGWSALYAPLGLWLYLILIINLAHLANILVTFQVSRYRHLPLAVKAGFVVGILLLALLAGGRAWSWSSGMVDLLRSTLGTVVLYPIIACWNLLLILVRGESPAAPAQVAGLAVLAVASFLLLLSRRENIYEPTIGLSEFKTAMRQAARAGNLQQVKALQLARRESKVSRHRLKPFGTGGEALVWNALVTSIGSGQRLLLMLVFVAAGVPIVIGLMSRYVGDPSFLQLAPLGTIYVAWILSLSLFRMQQADLQRVNTLKPMPIPGWQVLLSQVLPAALIWALLLDVSIVAIGFATIEPNLRLNVAVAVALPPLLLLLSTINAAMALVFPSSDDHTQTVVANFALMMLNALLVGPAIAIGAAAWFRPVAGWAVGLSAGAYCLVLTAVGLAVGACLYRRYDPSD